MSAPPSPRASWIRVLIGLAALLALVAVPGSAGATAACKKVSGKVTLTPVTGVECLSPQGVCIAGVLSGSLNGTSRFSASSITATSDTPTTGVVVLTGGSDYALKDGGLTSLDALLLRNTGNGDLSGIVTFIGSSGGLAGVTGSLQVQGFYLPDQGGGAAEYTGQLCG